MVKTGHKKLDDVINVLKIINVEIIGSYGNDRLRFKNDIDLQSLANSEKSHSQILKYFQNKIRSIEKMPDVYFSDFKAGKSGGIPVKWTSEDILRGYQIIGGREFTFLTALAQISTIKIDVIMKFRGRFIEITNNYYFYNPSENNRSFPLFSSQEVLNSLLFDYQQLKKTNLLKALKRLFSYYTLSVKIAEDNSSVRTDSLKSLDALQKIFNSKVGFISQNIAEIETIIILLKINPQNLKPADVFNSLENIHENLNSFPKYKIKTDMSEIKKLDFSQLINLLESELKTIKSNFDEGVRGFYFDNIISEEISLKYR